MNQEFFDTINRFIATGVKQPRILDVGCADLRPYSQFLVSVAGHYTGLDKNEALIAKARENASGSPCDFVIGYIEEADLPEASFDIVVCNNMLAYTDQQKTIRIIASLLKPGGLCISHYNNTIAYSLYKILHPFKPFYKEIPHSILVIVNTWVYRLTGKRVFRTVYHTKKSLTKLVKKNLSSTLVIHKNKSDLPYSVIHFYFVK